MITFRDKDRGEYERWNGIFTRTKSICTSGGIRMELAHELANQIRLLMRTDTVIN